MPDIRLAKLPDRTPIKLTVGLSPDLVEKLTAYASAYEHQYGVAEPIAELIPAMLMNFLESDRAFQRARTSAQSGKALK